MDNKGKERGFFYTERGGRHGERGGEERVGARRIWKEVEGRGFFYAERDGRRGERGRGRREYGGNGAGIEGRGWFGSSVPGPFF